MPLIEPFSSPGPLVFDPFVGRGITLVVAALCRQRYIGMEPENGYCGHACRRLSPGTRVRRDVVGVAQRDHIAAGVYAGSGGPATPGSWGGSVLVAGCIPQNSFGPFLR
jgi:hypothetical protein